MAANFSQRHHTSDDRATGLIAELPLTDKRILLLEDEVVVLLMAEDMLRDLGADVVGPASTLGQAMELAQTASIDAGLLDINIQGHKSFPVARALQARGVPVVFATGYGHPDFEALDGVRVIPKPYTQRLIGKALSTALDAAERPHTP